MMAKRPDARPANMNDFLRHFRSIELFKTPPAPPQPAQAKEPAGGGENAG
jgi:hypothetical protein